MDKLISIINSIIDLTIKFVNKTKVKMEKVKSETLEKIKLFLQKRKAIKTIYNPTLIELSKKETFYKEEIKGLKKLHNDLENKILSIENSNELLEEKIKLLGDLLTKN
ncbi:hypothetical protein GCM10008905_30220 [Clostridium malenominatum]|uniref:Uncharacterized protein n=1 Tax=Clostridium malenominatum TaxID=1539 RepID=A0ABN1J5Y3_9CLOT